MPKRRGIGQAELEVLNYIHDHHPVTVRQVADHVAATKGHARTTVLNVMTRLVNKGYLSRRRGPVGADGRGVYAYSPRVARAELLRTLVGDFVARALGGSMSPFVAYLAEDARLTDQDIAELRRVVSQLEPRSGGTKRAKGASQ
jgi:predicted transcriptional regulator